MANPDGIAPVAEVKGGPVDFAVVTALKLEREAVLKRLDEGYQSLKEDNEPLTYYYGHVTIPSSGERYTVVVVMLLGMGNEEAAVATTRVIQRWQPEHVLMVGIAGGVPGKVALGDVVVTDSIYYYEPAKLTPRGEERRPEDFVTSRLLYGRAKAYEASEWKGEVDVERPGAVALESGVPEARFGVIAAGEKVIADKKTLRKLLKANARIIAVAMEGGGLARAAFLEIRGVCVFADEHKNDNWQPYAANAAAAFTVGLLRSMPISPLEAKPQEGKTSPVIIMRAQSLRPIAPDELLGAFGNEFKGRDIETIVLDFTDFVRREVRQDTRAFRTELCSSRPAGHRQSGRVKAKGQRRGCIKLLLGRSDGIRGGSLSRRESHPYDRSSESCGAVLAFSALRYGPSDLLRPGDGSPRSHERACHPRCRTSVNGICSYGRDGYTALRGHAVGYMNRLRPL